MSRDGGPAFPQTMLIGPNGQMTSGWDGWGMGGMTLRDYFAAAALAGGCVYAKDAYERADQMLAEREKPR